MTTSVTITVELDDRVVRYLGMGRIEWSDLNHTGPLILTALREELDAQQIEVGDVVQVGGIGSGAYWVPRDGYNYRTTVVHTTDDLIVTEDSDDHRIRVTKRENVRLSLREEDL